MPISSRAYAGVADLERMLAWSVAANQAHPQQQYLHVGESFQPRYYMIPSSM